MSNKKKSYTQPVGVEADTPIEVESVAAPKVAPPSKKEISGETKVILRSVVPHLTYVAKRGWPELRWNKVDDTNSLTFDEFVDMRNQQSKFLDKPWLIIETEDVLDLFPAYRDLYASFASMEKLDWLNGSDMDVIAAKLGKVPQSMYSTLLSKVTGLIASGEIDNIKVIKLLEGKLGVKLLNLIV